MEGTGSLGKRVKIWYPPQFSRLLLQSDGGYPILQIFTNKNIGYA